MTLLENEVTVLQDEAEEIETDINQLDDELIKNFSKMFTLFQVADNSTDDLEIRVTLLENDVTVLQDDVQEMETDINQLDGGLLLVQGNVNDNSYDIDGDILLRIFENDLLRKDHYEILM